MKKRLMLLIAFVAIAAILCGCGNNLPSVKINPAMYKSITTIDIGKPYKYAGFDTVDVDGGKDLILHFVEAKK